MKRGQLQLIIFDWIKTFKSTENIFILFVAVLIGGLAGVGAWLVDLMIEVFTHWFQLFGHWSYSLTGYHWIGKLIIPAIGGALVGPLIYWGAREAKGHGVPEVIVAIFKQGGKIRPVVVVVKAISAAITIASGGSVGSEGPIVQIGAGLGSTLGQWFRVSVRHLRTFVGCGAAGGIAAAFNAPIAGALFAVEIILGDFGFAKFTPIVVSSVIATVVSRTLIGDHVFFNIKNLHFGSPVELISYALLGILAAFIGVLFNWILFKSEHLVDKVTTIPEYIKPIVGGLLLGMISLAFPEILGVGRKVMVEVVEGDYPLYFLLVMIFVKMVATSVTLSSGGSGGVFAPALFLGVMTGKIVGEISNMIIPSEKDTSGSFALVGMAALIGATMHAPLTAIFIIFELTSEYHLILPLMISTVIATTTASVLLKESVYTIGLAEKGINLQGGIELNVLKQVSVSKALNSEVEVIPMDLPINFVMDMLSQSSLSQHPVVDDNNHLIGMISTSIIRECLSDKDVLADFVIASDVVSKDFRTVLEKHDLSYVLEVLNETRMQEIYVVNSQDHQEVIGIITRNALLDAYHHQIMTYVTDDILATRLGKIQSNHITEVVEGYAILQTPINPSFEGKSLSRLRIRRKYGVSVLLIKRETSDGLQVMQPNADQKLNVTDQLIILGERSIIHQIHRKGWQNIKEVE
ncbi:MAG: CIC family chloride channel protein [bacterium]|jgi:CIC family chloride channel protein